MSLPFPAAYANAGSSQASRARRRASDRIIAIEEANHSYAHVHHVKELGKKFVRELEELL